jgi:hypothetical protein
MHSKISILISFLSLLLCIFPFSLHFFFHLFDSSTPSFSLRYPHFFSFVIALYFPFLSSFLFPSFWLFHPLFFLALSSFLFFFYCFVSSLSFFISFSIFLTLPPPFSPCLSFFSQKLHWNLKTRIFYLKKAKKQHNEEKKKKKKN